MNFIPSTLHPRLCPNYQAAESPRDRTPSSTFAEASDPFGILWSDQKEGEETEAEEEESCQKSETSELDEQEEDTDIARGGVAGLFGGEIEDEGYTQSHYYPHREWQRAIPEEFRRFRKTRKTQASAESLVLHKLLVLARQQNDLQNIALTVSDDHTEDGLHAVRLLSAALGKNSGGNLGSILLDLNERIETGFPEEPESPAKSDPGTLDLPDYIRTSVEPPSNMFGVGRRSQTSVRSTHEEYNFQAGIGDLSTSVVQSATGLETANSLSQNQQALQHGEGMSLEQLQEHIIHLQAKARRLEGVPKSEEPQKVQILFRIQQGDKMSIPYLDHPRDRFGDGGTLYSTSPIKNIELYLERHKEITLVVYRDFGQIHNKALEDQEITENGVLPTQIKHYREVLWPVSDEMSNAIRMILGSRPEYDAILKSFDSMSEISSPFLFFFHSFKDLETIKKQANDTIRRQLEILATYIWDVYGALYNAAESMISQGQFSAEYLCYFYKPNDVLVYRERENIKGYICDSWLGQPRDKKAQKQDRMWQKGKRPVKANINESEDATTKTYIWEIAVWSWSYDGHFYREKTTLALEVSGLKQNVQEINRLSIYPLQFAEP
ncbi:hypothetical protein LTR84_003487 [Exophiala bonariae]|uniref:DUF7025 domain-containing protein n=1 Tax=Exophiala bonariae TaxID=1690606 RepID=A0AAV9N7F0_9EURO|nr:hypothetical protein LTR84_003487 [Exophiala bonariae]